MIDMQKELRWPGAGVEDAGTIEDTLKTMGVIIKHIPKEAVRIERQEILYDRIEYDFACVEEVAREIFGYCILEEEKRRKEQVQHGGYEIMHDSAKEHYRQIARWHLSKERGR